MEQESTVDTEALTGIGLKAEEIVSQMTQCGLKESLTPSIKVRILVPQPYNKVRPH